MLTYGFDAGGGCGTLASAGANTNRSSKTDNGATTTYCYDNADRLTATSDANFDSFEYDSHGNTTAITGGGSPGHADVVLADDPLAYWRLGESSAAGAAVDASGNGNDGDYNGTVTVGVGGAIEADTAATFTGASDSTVFTPDLGLVEGGDFSVEAWVKTTESRTWRYVFSEGNTASLWAQWGLMLNAGKPRLYLRQDNATEKFIQGPAAVNDNAWHHLAATREGDVFKLYVDGVEVGSLSYALGALTVNNGRIGSWRTAWPAAHLAGTIDDVAVYDHALSAADVAEHHANTGAGGGGSGSAQIMTYDVADRHSSTTAAGTTVAYVRDATGRIVQREVNGVIEARYSYSGGGDAPAVTLDDQNSVIEATLVLPGGVIVTRREAEQVWSYPNIHGDVVATADASGTKQGATIGYDPDGNTATAPDNSSGAFDYTWLGSHQRPLEHQAGLLDTIEMGARQYLPALGRFIEADPVEGGSANAYDYANGDATNSRDLFGRYPTSYWHAGYLLELATVGSWQTTMVFCIPLGTKGCIGVRWERRSTYYRVSAWEMICNGSWTGRRWKHFCPELELKVGYMKRVEERKVKYIVDEYGAPYWESYGDARVVREGAKVHWMRAFIHMAINRTFYTERAPIGGEWVAAMGGLWLAVPWRFV